MYRTGAEYNRLDRIVIDIYIDYGFNSFPLDEKAVCRAMGIALVPYSEYIGANRDVLHKRSKYGFFVPETRDNTPTIFYNDDLDELQSPGCIRHTIFHEIKHYVDEDHEESPDDDDLADHFGRYFACPTPYLIVQGIQNPNEVISRFGVSATMASNIVSNIRNRIAKHGIELFDYEKPLIKLLDPIYFELFLA